jgi:hypothetical protein
MMDDRAAVMAIRRSMVVAEIRRAAGVHLRPEVRQILQRVQVIALRKLAEETAAALECTGNRRAALRAMLNGTLDPRRAP